MNNDGPFIRNVLVKISMPLNNADLSRGGKEYTFKGDGSAEKLRIKFTVHKHMASTGIPSLIQIYNLTRESRQILSATADATMTLSAGWQNTQIVQIFKGALLYVTHQRDGANIVTNLMSIEGYFGSIKQVINATAPNGNQLQTLVYSLASEMPDIDVDMNFINVPNITFGNQGFTYAGTTDMTLDKLSRTYGFTWWIHNGIFYTKIDGQPFDYPSVLVNESNGLIRADPMLFLAADALENRQTGITVNTFFNPNIKAGGKIKLQSVLNDRLNGEYEVHNITHMGDTHGDSWTTIAENARFFIPSASLR